MLIKLFIPHISKAKDGEIKWLSQGTEWVSSRAKMCTYSSDFCSNLIMLLPYGKKKIKGQFGECMIWWVSLVTFFEVWELPLHISRHSQNTQLIFAVYKPNRTRQLKSDHSPSCTTWRGWKKLWMVLCVLRSMTNNLDHTQVSVLVPPRYCLIPPHSFHIHLSHYFEPFAKNEL